MVDLSFVRAPFLFGSCPLLRDLSGRRSNHQIAIGLNLPRLLLDILKACALPSRSQITSRYHNLKEKVRESVSNLCNVDYLLLRHVPICFPCPLPPGVVVCLEQQTFLLSRGCPAENHIPLLVERPDVHESATGHAHGARIVHALLDRAARARRLQVRRERRGRVEDLHACVAGVFEALVDLRAQVGAEAKFGDEGLATRRAG